tara:strand:+ start:463 stop:588 length:126 start_codon:yes stop_codon:yes gene_type:complete
VLTQIKTILKKNFKNFKIIQKKILNIEKNYLICLNYSEKES